jgi:anti-sigma factor RsiW
MDCQDFLEEYSDYLDWRLEEHALVEYRRHVSSCPRCAEYDRVVRSSLQLVRGLDRPEASSEVLPRVQQRVHELYSDARGRWSDFGVALAAAGVTAVVVLLVTSVAVPRQDALELPPVVVEQARTDELPSVFGPAPRFVNSPSLLRVPELSGEGLLATPRDRISLFRAPLRAGAEPVAEDRVAVTQ